MSRRALILLIGALWIAEMASSFETAMILAALKVLVAEFGDATTVGWLITSYLIVGAASSAVVGRLGDLYGRQQVTLIVLAIGVIGSVVSATADAFPQLLAGRILQGVTTTILPLGIGLVRENVPAKRLPLAVGVLMSGASVGTAAGLVLGGFVIDQFDWHALFWTSAMICAVSLALVWALVPGSCGVALVKQVDWKSGILFAPGITLVLLYLTGAKTWGWASSASLFVLAGGIALCVWWWHLAMRSANPLIDVRALSDRRIAVSCAATALVAMGTLQITVFFSLLLQAPTWTIAGLGLTATVAGLIKLPSNLTSVLAGPLGGWITGRGGGRLAMLVGGAITTLGWCLALIDISSAGVILAELVVISFGTSMLFAVCPTIIAQAAPPDRTSELTGMLTVIRAVFMGVGSQIVVNLLAADSVVRGPEHYPSPFAYQLALGAIIALTVAATLVSLALPRDTSASIRERQFVE